MNPSIAKPAALHAGASTVDLTPDGPVFLFGYPHVPRVSTGVHDRLEGTALYLRSGDGQALFVANDVICVGRRTVNEIRQRICAETGVPEAAIMITATHTHSGPVMTDYISNGADPVVPKADPAWLAQFVARVVRVAGEAVRKAEPAKIGFGTARIEGVGTNRHDPAGPADPEAAIVVVRALRSAAPLAAMLVYGMHPTVLHEDTTEMSGDFPHFTREFLRQGVLSRTCPVLFHQGASGNQSPRHVTRANTFAEAERLGHMLGRAVAEGIDNMEYLREIAVVNRQAFLDLVPRRFPPPGEAAALVSEARSRFEQLGREGASRQAVRTAECDLFGREETAELARAAADGRLEEAIAACTPAEIQLLRIGPWNFVGWPGEFFVEYALELKRRAARTFLITLANGELQGYIATPEAAARGVYEANNAVFAPENGSALVRATLALLGNRE